MRNKLPVGRLVYITIRQESNYRRQLLRSAYEKWRRRVVGPYACLYCSQLFGILLGSIWIGRLGLLREQRIQPHSRTTTGFAKHRNFMGPGADVESVDQASASNNLGASGPCPQPASFAP